MHCWTAFRQLYAKSLHRIVKDGIAFVAMCSNLLKCYNPDAVIGYTDIRDGAFLLDPDSYTVTKGTTVLLIRDGKQKTIKDADIADIRALPDDAQVVFLADGTGSSGGTQMVSVSDFLAAYAE